MRVVNQVITDNYALYHGDSGEILKGLPNNSVDFSVFSPPFSHLYVYSNSERDLGNSRDDDEFMNHFYYIVEDLLRVTKPGRIAAIHVADIPAMLVRDGYIGLKDFSGDIVRLFISCGWIWDARIPIDKNQQAQSIRTHSKALTMTQFEKDRTWLRPALPDYILKFRKPGENTVPVRGGDVSRDWWIGIASPSWPNEHDRCLQDGAFPTWYGIKESDTLNVTEARGSDDERHICPLQLGTIERCIRLWSNEGETVLSPFAGIGSEGYQSILFNRKFIGVELKTEYYKAAAKNLRHAQEKLSAGKQVLFSGLDETESISA